MKGRPVRVAVVQADVHRRRPDRNLERLDRFTAEAARRGAAVVIFPELYLSGYEVWTGLRSLSLPARSPVLMGVAAAARRHRTAVMVGYPERRPEGLYNSVCVATATGAVFAPYRKIHLFGRERRYFRPGSRHRLVRLGRLTVGPLICFDLEFPESARILALAGAQLIAVSTANMEPYRDAQEVYVRARAQENQVFVALANRVGHEGRTRFVGGSGVWDPSGRTLAHGDGDEGVFVATVDLRALRRTRQPFDYLRERRPACYRSVLTGRH
jgi:predicted amidohydrolase